MYTFKAITTSATRLQALAVYQANADYFKQVGDVPPTLVSVLDDARTLPAGVNKGAKHFDLITQGAQVVGVVDWLTGYPDAGSVYLGLLMMHPTGQGHGQRVFAQLVAQWQAAGYRQVQLGVVTADQRAMAFWQRQGFAAVRADQARFANGHEADVAIMQRTL